MTVSVIYNLYSSLNDSVIQLQIKDDIKAARIEAARRTFRYVEQSKTSQQR
jgi:hypothetical protein